MPRDTSLEKREVKSDSEKTSVVSEMKVLESVSNLEISSCVVNLLAEFSPWISDLTRPL